MLDSVADVSTPPAPPLENIRGIIFDMDGVLYRGKQALPGVTDLFNALTLRGIPFLLATNNSMATQAAYVERMAGMGVAVNESQIQTSASVTRDYLLAELPEGSVILPIGMPPLVDVFRTGTSFRIADDVPDESIDAVVVGLDLEFTYAKLRRASDAIRNGAQYIATNADATLPHESGEQPGAGSIVAAISTASGKAPIIIGKPETQMMSSGVAQLGLQPEETLMVGDRLSTDILGGYRAGLKTALVLTGVSQRADLAASDVLPDFIFDDLPALMQAIIGHG